MDESWIAPELRAVRNFHQSFQHGLWRGLAHTAVQYVTGGRGLIDPMRMPAGYTEYHKLDGALDGASSAPPRFQGDGVLTFDRLTDVYHSGTRHEEDQPCHLHVLDPTSAWAAASPNTAIPANIFVPRPSTKWWKTKAARRLKINFSNCVHCKTCDIADPYQIIDWVPPEGGGGPKLRRHVAR